MTGFLLNKVNRMKCSTLLSFIRGGGGKGGTENTKPQSQP